MSRSRKGRKGPGYEYSSRRGSAAGIDYATPGPFSKKITSRSERRAASAVIAEEEYAMGFRYCHRCGYIGMLVDHTGCSHASVLLKETT